MRRALAACAAIPLIAAPTPLAQSRPPDLSGRWQLVEPTAAERALDTLVIGSPDQLLVRQTPFAITVEHPSTPGTHPEAGVFKYGSRGVVGGLPGRGTTTERWDVSHLGSQLTISHSTTTAPPNPSGLRITSARGSMWRLEGPDRLAIELREERTGERPKVATRIYVRLTSP